MAGGIVIGPTGQPVILQPDTSQGAAQITTAAPRSPRYLGEGLLARFAPLAGVTPATVMRSPFWLPALLGTLVVNDTASFTDYDTVSSGQYSQPAAGDLSARQQRTLSADTLTVDFDYGWLVAGGQDPQALRDTLDRILWGRRAVELMVTWRPSAGEPPVIHMDCTLRTLSREVRPGERDARYMTLGITEWRSATTARRGSTQQTRFPTTRALTATDTLHSLAYLYYRDYAKWRQIRDEPKNHIPRAFAQNTPLVRLPRYKVGSKIVLPVVK
jgi:hypothetical protein